MEVKATRNEKLGQVVGRSFQVEMSGSNVLLQVETGTWGMNDAVESEVRESSRTWLI